MKAIVVRAFGGPEVMNVEQLPDPSPGPLQVLVRVKAAGVNPVDTYIRAGTYARKPNLPYTPGADIAGTVEAVGAGVTHIGTGDRVYAHGVAAGSGGYAEFAVCDEAQVHTLPDDITFQQGAAIGVPYGTAWRALVMKAQPRPGETVLVHGASGGVGIAAVQIARLRGLRVIGTAGSERGLTLLRDQRAHHVLNHKEADYLQQVPALTGGRGADVIVEMLANVNLDRDLDVLALRGRIVIVGNRGRIEIDPRKIMAKEGAVLGLVGLNTTAEDLREMHAGIGAGLEVGVLKPVIGRELPLADAPQAHAAVLEPGAYGKIVLVP
jgi:NADPH2:quinone reductase